MTDPVQDLLSQAVAIGAPPDDYWRRYSTRLRARLEEPESATAWWVNPLFATAAIAAAIVLFVFFRENRIGTAAIEPPSVSVVEEVQQPTAAVPAPALAEKEEQKPQTIAPPKEKEPQRIEPLPLRSITVKIAEFTKPGIEVTPPAPVVVHSGPPALTLTDFRLLRNGVEIARGDKLDAGPNGMIWFAERSGRRFALSTTQQPGFREIGVAQGNLVTFDWGPDRFYWISATPIVDGEVSLWVSMDRIAAVPPTMPPLPDRWRWPPLLGPEPVPRGPRLQRQMRDRGKAEAKSGETPDIRFGTARSLDELAQQRE